MSISPLQSAVSNIQRFFQNQSQPGNGLPGPTPVRAAASPASAPADISGPSTLSSSLTADAAKLLSDVQGFLIGQQSSPAVSAAPATTGLQAPDTTPAGHVHHRHGNHRYDQDAAPPGTSASSGTPPSSQDTAGLLGSVGKALQAYARQHPVTAGSSTPLQTAA